MEGLADDFNSLHRSLIQHVKVLLGDWQELLLVHDSESGGVGLDAIAWVEHLDWH